MWWEKQLIAYIGANKKRYKANVWQPFSTSFQGPVADALYWATKWRDPTAEGWWLPFLFITFFFSLRRTHFFLRERQTGPFNNGTSLLVTYQVLFLLLNSFSEVCFVVSSSVFYRAFPNTLYSIFLLDIIWLKGNSNCSYLL